MIPLETAMEQIRMLSERFNVPEPIVDVNNPRCREPGVMGCFIPPNYISLNTIDGKYVDDTVAAHEFAHYLAYMYGITDGPSEDFARRFERWYAYEMGMLHKDERLVKGVASAASFIAGFVISKVSKTHPIIGMGLGALYAFIFSV